MVAILLIEDDPLVRRGLQLALTRHGHDVRVAVRAGARALQEIRIDLAKRLDRLHQLGRPTLTSPPA